MQPNNNGVGAGAPVSAAAPKEDIVFRDKPRKNTGMTIGMVVLALLAAGGIGFGVWTYLSGNQKETDLNNEINTIRQQNNELQNEINSLSSNNNTSDEDAKVCEGKYYGESSGTTPNGLSYDYKYTYNLNKDGTFTASFGDVSGTEGVYLINGNTISLIGKSETTGPEGETTQYSTKDYIIADDCSYIKINDGEVSFDLMMQE